MAQQSLLGRVGQLVRANINALLDQAEDPQKMLDQLVRDYSNSIADAESAIASHERDLPERETNRLKLLVARRWKTFG